VRGLEIRSLFILLNKPARTGGGTSWTFDKA